MMQFPQQQLKKCKSFLPLPTVVTIALLVGGYPAGSYDICDQSQQYIRDIGFTSQRYFDAKLQLISTSANQCRRTFTCAGLSGPPRHLVLLGEPAGDRGSQGRERSVNPTMWYQLEDNTYSVEAGIVHGVILNDNSCRIPVTYNRSSLQPLDAAPPGLRAVLLLTGDCARGFLPFSGSCYTVSAARSSLHEAMRKYVRGIAQLANFSSDAEISRFIAENTARARKYPYKIPLVLKESLRLAVFYRTADATVLSLACNSTKCWLQKASNITKFRVRTRGSNGLLCGFIKTASNASNWEIVFDDCATAAGSLVSISMTAEAESHIPSAEDLDKLVADALNETAQVIEQPSKSNWSSNSETPWLTIFLPLCVLCIALLCRIGLAFFVRNKVRDCLKYRALQVQVLDRLTA